MTNPTKTKTDPVVFWVRAIFVLLFFAVIAIEAELHSIANNEYETCVQVNQITHENYTGC